MPALVLFNRRWSIGSDDLIVPSSFLFLGHLFWINVLIFIFVLVEFDKSNRVEQATWILLVTYTITLVITSIIELAICIISLRGSILDSEARKPINFFIYLKTCFLLIELVTLLFGSTSFIIHYETFPKSELQEVIWALIVCNWGLVLVTFVFLWCSYDAAGKSWFKMNKFQKSFDFNHFQYKRSGSVSRNWRRRKMIRDYESSWNHRCRLLLCCISLTDRNKRSFSNIARLLTDFFRDLDIVPTDVIAGLILLRKFQKIELRKLLEQQNGDIIEILSGVPIKSTTKVLDLKKSTADFELFEDIHYYMSYALGAYGWPLYVKSKSTAEICQLITKSKQSRNVEIIEDNCCKCNFKSLKDILKNRNVEFIYVTYHVDVGQAPFFVAVDYDKKSVVLSIRGTLSFQDILTDLNAESDPIPIEPINETWTGHKGIIEVAQYIRNILINEELLDKAFNHNTDKGTKSFRLVIVGHSLGAGTASVLAILLRPKFPDLKCFSYAPPGGLLSQPAADYTKEFITSVVVGKDVVPRLGLRQMETLRADLINALKMSIDPKWKTLICSAMCCGCASEPRSVANLKEEDIRNYQNLKESTRNAGLNLFDTSATLLMHYTPLYPPGRIIHIVRRHDTNQSTIMKKTQISYHAVCVDNTDYSEILISPVMIHDHMPDNMLKILQQTMPATKPKKRVVETKSVCLETSFTSTPCMTPRAMNKRKFDLIHDDWMGLAPLASPETLSSASSHLKTPKIMRRAPKITENLAFGAYDTNIVNKFQQMLTSNDKFDMISNYAIDLSHTTYMRNSSSTDSANNKTISSLSMIEDNSEQFARYYMPTETNRSPNLLLHPRRHYTVYPTNGMPSSSPYPFPRKNGSMTTSGSVFSSVDSYEK